MHCIVANPDGCLHGYAFVEYVTDRHGKGKGRYTCNSSWEPQLRATGRHSLAILDHTMLPATRHK